MKNIEIAKILYEIAELLEFNEVEYKPRAYRRAAQNIEILSEDIVNIYKKGRLDDIPGVGKSIASKIQEYIETGDLKYLNDLRDQIPHGLQDLLKVEGIGPKTAQILHKELAIKNVDELELAINEGKLKSIKGFGKKKEENLLQAIELYKTSQERFLLGDIWPIAKNIKSKLESLKTVIKVEFGGSIRRRKETIGDIDLLVVSTQPKNVMEFFTKLPEKKSVISSGEIKSTIILNNNIQVDLTIVENSSYGSALQYFTGSKEHNIQLRELAKKNNMKLNEFGLFNLNDNKKIAGAKETEIYELLGLTYIHPELRENRGEIDFAMAKKLPKLVELGDIKGDLHTHTKWSDGSNSIEEMAIAAKNLRYNYIAICDHSKTLQIAGGLNENDLRSQMTEIERTNRKLEDFRILSGVEVNIDSEGNLDLNNSILKDLDFVVASIHSGFKQSEQVLIKRVLNAMHNDYVNCIGHPSGRIINKRAPAILNFSEIFEEAEKLNIFLEINAFPDRLDLSDLNCFKAREHNICFSIGSDAHNLNQLNFMDYGVAVARRGWLESKSILNAMDLKQLKRSLGL
ncbi:MAG: DNA polymerase/3'-5' exonuclease PolX [Candidatus Hermodarchaeota archaeon]